MELCIWVVLFSHLPVPRLAGVGFWCGSKQKGLAESWASTESTVGDSVLERRELESPYGYLVRELSPLVPKNSLK